MMTRCVPFCCAAGDAQANARLLPLSPPSGGVRLASGTRHELRPVPPSLTPVRLGRAWLILPSAPARLLLLRRTHAAATPSSLLFSPVNRTEVPPTPISAILTPFWHARPLRLSCATLSLRPCIARTLVLGHSLLPKRALGALLVPAAGVSPMGFLRVARTSDLVRLSFRALLPVHFLCCALLRALHAITAAHVSSSSLGKFLEALPTAAVVTAPSSPLWRTDPSFVAAGFSFTADPARSFSQPRTCGKVHTQHRCFSRLVDAWRAEFGDDVKLPRWADLLRSHIAIFDLDFDAILSAMYALSVSAEGDYYWSVPPDPGIGAAPLGASESSTLPGIVPAQALHTFTFDSGTSRCFFRDNITLTPLPAPVPFRLDDPSGGPDVAHSSTVLPCPAVPSSSLSGLHLPSFTTNLHHHLGHPSLPSLRGMHSRLLVSSLPRSVPPLPPSLAPPYLPCVEGRQRAAPHSSSFPPMTAPLETLHMDVWGPACVSGQSREQNFLLVVDDYTRYSTVFPLRSRDHPILGLHSDRGGEFSSNLLRDFYCGEGFRTPLSKMGLLSAALA
ncbi:unnamed protein product [Closterium sp. NIES-53]